MKILYIFLVPIFAALIYAFLIRYVRYVSSNCVPPPKKGSYFNWVMSTALTTTFEAIGAPLVTAIFVILFFPLFAAGLLITLFYLKKKQNPNTFA